MKLEDLKKLVKAANQLHNMKVMIKPNSNDRDLIKLWVYEKYERKPLGLPSLRLSSKTTAEETDLVRKAIEMRNAMESSGNDTSMSKANPNTPASKLLAEWVSHYAVEISKRGAGMAKDKWLEANGDMPASQINRRTIIKMMDMMNGKNYHGNYVRNMMSRFRAFCNWAEQRGYIGRIDTRKLLPPEQFGEVKALNEDELKLLAATPCEACPDVKDLFMLGVYTAQRMGEIRNYTFALLNAGKIKARQGKTGKFIIIPLSEAALSVMQGLKERREKEGKNTGDKDKIFSLPSEVHLRMVFKRWLEAAGLKDRIALHNSRSTAISLLINKGVPMSVTQELANHSDPSTTARYYRQIDDSKKKEALALIPMF